MYFGITSEYERITAKNRKKKEEREKRKEEENGDATTTDGGKGEERCRETFAHTKWFSIADEKAFARA